MLAAPGGYPTVVDDDDDDDYDIYIYIYIISCINYPLLGIHQNLHSLGSLRYCSIYVINSRARALMGSLKDSMGIEGEPESSNPIASNPTP